MGNIKLFENKKIRVVYDEEKEDYYFSVVDVVAVLSNSQSKDISAYWRKLKQRLKKEGSELVTNCHRLKLEAQDGKQRETDVLDTKGILRLIQSIPSPKAEPFKVWLASVGSERLDEISNPSLAIDRGLQYYRNKGYDDSWINQRIQSIGIRKELTDEWRNRGITEEKDYAILTNEMLQAWSGMSVKEYKDFKGLKKESLRDNMSNIEIVLNMLAEVTATELSKKEKPKTFEENKKVARSGGKTAKIAKEDIERKLTKNILENKKE